MNRRLLFTLIFILTVHQLIFAQLRRPRSNFSGTIVGYVYDEVSKQPIEYANIILYTMRDSSRITGTITDKNGFFRLQNVPVGRYFIEVDFIGYAKIQIPHIRVFPRHPEVKLKEIFLSPVAIIGEGVEVEGERVPITYQLDKKVINVSKQTTTLSGTAVDVLENVPSINVDIEGNVSLRGSGSFTLLIDGRPTLLEPEEILQQIPASSIETIEIITNPSAKYDPDGVSGIINIILKKNKLRGFSGFLYLNMGNNDRYGGNFLLSYRNKKIILNLAMDYNQRHFPGNNRIDQYTVQDSLTLYSQSEGDASRLMKPYGLRGSVEINLGYRNILSLGGRLGSRSMERGYLLTYRQWSSAQPEKTLSYSDDNWKRSGDYYSLNLNYQHTWRRKGHQLLAQLIYSRRTGDEKSTNELRKPDKEILEGKISTEEGPASGWRFKTEYSQPLGQNSRLEAGYQNRWRNSTDNKKVFDYDPLQNRYLYQPLFSNFSRYQRNIHSLYFQFSSQLVRLEYQFGLRGEYTYRKIRVRGNKSFLLDRMDYFPTAHISYRALAHYQVMGSYTRRINRPRGWWLEPFLTWGDAYNVYRGNPALHPEYVDSYELNHRFLINKNVISLEAFYRITNNKVERIRSAYLNNVILHTYENVGKARATGLEFLWNTDLFNWWNINYMGSLYRYRVTGFLNRQDFSHQSNNWSARLNNTFRMFRNNRIQINLRYQSPTVTSQGRSEAFFSTDLAFQQQFFNKQLSLTLQIRDIFQTMRHEYESRGTDFYYYRRFEIDSPFLSFNIRWIFNNYKLEQKRPFDMEENGGEEDIF